jgi:hypothetical protein
MTEITIEQSNSLADLAARIKNEPRAAADTLKASVRHGIAAGDLLIEAKAQLKHGQWLPWLRDYDRAVEFARRSGCATRRIRGKKILG